MRKIRWALQGTGKRGASDVRQVRMKMKLSQAQFATRFGLPPATLRNWEQGRSQPDAPTRVLLAVIAKHPEIVEDVLRKVS
ncbi:helix-turn-helix domain-containing protein [Nevskia soli]|uniref:helix-turn-helix domain-containing protein n=1 Tax=Nevskia soli TaxID=418856 RepID=UPI0015D87217|nr:helix-turn-helix domain-containing protein [Nevskia soli]